MWQERCSFSDCRLQVGSTEVPRRGYAEHLPTLASGSKAHYDGLWSLPHAGNADLLADHHGAVSKRACGLISPAARLTEDGRLQTSRVEQQRTRRLLPQENLIRISS